METGPSRLSVPAHLTPGYCHWLQVAEEWAQGTFKLNPNDEDIHTANERRLKVRPPPAPLACPRRLALGHFEHRHHHSVPFVTGRVQVGTQNKRLRQRWQGWGRTRGPGAGKGATHREGGSALT